MQPGLYLALLVNAYPYGFIHIGAVNLDLVLCMFLVFNNAVLIQY